MNIKFLGKCALVEEQVKPLKERGCNQVEVFMLTNDLTDKDRQKETRELIDKYQINTENFHITHYDINKKFPRLGDFRGDIIELHYELFKLHLEYIKTVTNVDISNLILHSGASLSNNFFNVEYVDIVKETQRFQLKRMAEYAKDFYPNIRLLIENSMPLNHNKGDDVGINVYSKGSDTVNLIKDINMDNCGFILDTCHAYQEIIHNRLNGNIEMDGIKKYVENTKCKLKGLHLTNIKNLGIGSEDHGGPFEKSNHYDIIKIKDLFGALKDIGFEGNITLEVHENGNDNYENYDKTRKCIEWVFKDITDHVVSY